MELVYVSLMKKMAQVLKEDATKKMEKVANPTADEMKAVIENDLNAFIVEPNEGNLGKLIDGPLDKVDAEEAIGSEMYNKIREIVMNCGYGADQDKLDSCAEQLEQIKSQII